MYLNAERFKARGVSKLLRHVRRTREYYFYFLTSFIHVADRAPTSALYRIQGFSSGGIKLRSIIYRARARATITLPRILNSPIIHESRSRPRSLETRELNRIAQLNLTQSRTKSSPMNCSVPM